MNETEFERLASDTIARIEQTLDESDTDIDYETVGGILTLEFSDGSKIIINKQGPARQIWVAARSGGFHYGYQDGLWRNDQGGTELLEELERLIRSQGGGEIALAARR